MSTPPSRKAIAICALGATLALIPSELATADSPPTGLSPSQINPVDQAIDNVVHTPAVTQTLNIFGSLAGDGGATVWGVLDLMMRTQIPRSPVDSTPIQLSPNYNQLANDSASAVSGAAAQGTGRLEVVGTRVARDGRSVRIKVACVGGNAGCDGVVRLTRRHHGQRLVMARHVRLASGATAKYTLRV